MTRNHARQISGVINQIGWLAYGIRAPRMAINDGGLRWRWGWFWECRALAWGQFWNAHLASPAERAA